MVKSQSLEIGIRGKKWGKQKHTNVYLNLNAHASTTWKISTIRSLVKRASLSHQQKQRWTTSYPTYKKYSPPSTTIKTKWLITPLTLKELKPSPHWMKRIKPWKTTKTITDALNNPNNKMRVIYNTKKLSSNFPVKDKTNPHHQHNVVYHAECPEPNCSSNYTGQTKCRLLKRVIQHNRTDKNSHLLKHSSSNNHHRIWMEDFKILGSGYKSNFKRKISEALFIKEKKPDLNVQKDAYTLKLYHWRHNISTLILYNGLRISVSSS